MQKSLNSKVFGAASESFYECGRKRAQQIARVRLGAELARV
jgi:hypothetical protein